MAAFVGCLAGAIAGAPLGLLIAWIIMPGWSLMTAIIVAHVSLAMLAMGAWAIPALVAKPEKQ